jgi:outer membrane protein
MRNSIKLLIFTFLLSISVVGYCQQKPLKFGHINTEDILTSMPERDSAAVQMEKFGKELQDQLEGMNVERNKKIEIYTKEQKTSAELVNKSREEEISQLNQRIQQFQQSAQDEYQQKQVQLMQPIMEKMQKAISDVGKENGFIYIFTKNDQIIPFISADSQDVTLLVKQKLGIKDKPKAQAPAQK